MINKRNLPMLNCETCGNCELNFHKEESLSLNNGFCMRFFQNVDKSEKNPACWTSKPHDHYDKFATLKDNINTANNHKNIVLAKRKKILDNLQQTTLF
jgi:hypothetical protein